jgi:hypothetical protein
MGEHRGVPLNAYPPPDEEGFSEAYWWHEPRPARGWVSGPPVHPLWDFTDDVSSDDAVRCSETWDFGGNIGRVQCSREDKHDAHHFANGDNRFNIYYRWDTISRRDLAERESLHG